MRPFEKVTEFVSASVSKARVVAFLSTVDYRKQRPSHRALTGDPIDAFDGAIDLAFGGEVMRREAKQRMDPSEFGAELIVLRLGGAHVDLRVGQATHRLVRADAYERCGEDGASVGTETAVTGTSGSHTTVVTLPDGAYTVRYNAQDQSGKISQTGTFAFVIDATAPTATVKDGAAYTVGAGGSYDLVSFKLSDAGKIDKVTINGTVKNLTDNAWSDVNFIKPGVFGAVSGVNTLVVYDVAGNTSTTTFILN